MKLRNNSIVYPEPEPVIVVFVFIALYALRKEEKISFHIKTGLYRRKCGELVLIL